MQEQKNSKLLKLIVLNNLKIKIYETYIYYSILTAI